MSKPSLIFIHGLRGNHKGLQQITDQFRDYKIYTPDLPPNHRPLKNYTSSEYAKWIINYIKENNLKNPILIGHSFGSIVSAAVAENYPDLIHKKLIFISPISKKPAKFFNFIIGPFQLLPDTLLDIIITRFLLIPMNFSLFNSSLKATKLSRQDTYSRGELVKCAKFSSKHAVSDFNFNKNLLIIAGEKDRLNSLTKTKKIAEKNHAKLIILPKSGHLINFEKPDTIAQEIKKFIGS